MFKMHKNFVYCLNKTIFVNSLLHERLISKVDNLCYSMSIISSENIKRLNCVSDNTYLKWVKILFIFVSGRQTIKFL